MSGREAVGPRPPIHAAATRPLAFRRARWVASLLMSVAVAASCSSGGKLVGQPAPEFSLTDLQDRAVRLANLKGKVVFLNVWATWCEPCRAEMPSMQALYDKLRGPSFEMLAVSADQGGKPIVEAFVREMALGFPVLLDPEQQISSRYGVTGYPETFIIDRNGRVVAHEIGPRRWDAPEAREALQTLIDRGEWRGL